MVRFRGVCVLLRPFLSSKPNLSAARENGIGIFTELETLILLAGLGPLDQTLVF